MSKIILLRVVHGLFAVYFLLCLLYLYYASLFSHIDVLLFIAVMSLGLEGVAVFVLNKGDCPLIHIQRKIGDNTPFFNLLFPARVAQQMVPALTIVAWIGIGLLILRFVMNYLYALG